MGKKRGTSLMDVLLGGILYNIVEKRDLEENLVLRESSGEQKKGNLIHECPLTERSMTW